jgi:hypothetical protein
MFGGTEAIGCHGSAVELVGDFLKRICDRLGPIHENRVVD